jgi:hypothetical protein
MKTKEQDPKESQRAALEHVIAKLTADPVGERAKISKMVTNLERELAAMGRVKALVMSGTVAKCRKVVDASKIQLVLLDMIENGTLRIEKDAQGRMVRVIGSANPSSEIWFRDFVRPHSREEA